VAAVALSAVMIGNALLLVFLLGGPFVDLIYALPGFPDQGSLDAETRRALAVDGVASIRPLGPGIEILRDARLAGGEPAFNARELTHMDDVRRVVAGFGWAWLIGAALLLSLGWLARKRPGGVERMRLAIRRAAGALIALIATTGVVFLVAFEPVFEGFHAIFFSGDSWRFAADDTLIELYPETFWAVAGIAIVALIIAQCLALLVLLRRPRI
jgi:integral membrane protein (TIGR01906 family)